MARGNRPGGGHVPGFRPGKEPPHLRKQRAKQQFGDVSPTQERLIELFAERTPEQARMLIRRWSLGALIGAIVLAVLGLVLLTWSIIAGVIVLILSGGILFLWWRLKRQQAALEEMADAVSGRGPNRGRPRRGRK